jgi:hypothetical protein
VTYNGMLKLPSLTMGVVSGRVCGEKCPASMRLRVRLH